MRVTSGHFIDNLESSGLLTSEEVHSLRTNLRRDEAHQDGKSLARRLVHQGKLTKFQAQAIYHGNVKGLVLGDYIILDHIGSGGMGEVYRARHHRMKRVVALKVLPDAATKSPDLLRRFYNEVEAAAKLAHPHVVTAFDASEQDGIHYLVMEFVDGQDLASIIKEHGPFPVEQAVTCVIQAARGLDYAHSQGVVHRDIKPANLLLAKEGTVKVLDMGLARVRQTVEKVGGDDDTAAEELTSSGHVIGTCDYMAPEQAEDSHQADPRSDVYSLGCTLFRMLTGHAPYKSDSVIKTLLGHRQDAIPSVREQRDDVPAWLDEVCWKMMAKDPNDRFQSMVLMSIGPQGIYVTGGSGLCVIEDSLIWANITSNARFDAKNSIFCTGEMKIGGRGCNLSCVTSASRVFLTDPASVLLDSILMSVSAKNGGHRISHCNVFGTPPFLEQATGGASCFPDNPRLRDSAGSDFRLQDNSPCKGKASDGGDVGCRLTDEMLRMCEETARLAETAKW